MKVRVTGVEGGKIAGNGHGAHDAGKEEGAQGDIPQSSLREPRQRAGRNSDSPVGSFAKGSVLKEGVCRQGFVSEACVRRAKEKEEQEKLSLSLLLTCVKSKRVIRRMYLCSLPRVDTE